MRILDLSWTIREGMPRHPLHPVAPLILSGTLSHTVTARWMGEHPRFGRVSFTNEQIVINGHVGTHVDAPLHAAPGGAAADAIDLSACVGRASRLDLRHLCRGGALIGAADLEAALIPRDRPASILLLNTGWTALLEMDAEQYFRNSMGLDASAAEWVRYMGVRCVGIDAPSIDSPEAREAPAHMSFLRDIPPVYVIENLRCLDQLPDEVPLFLGAPLPLAGSSGSPIRAMAVLDDSMVDGPDGEPERRRAR